jgi:hypothetical protein
VTLGPCLGLGLGQYQGSLDGYVLGSGSGPRSESGLTHSAPAGTLWQYQDSLNRYVCGLGLGLWQYQGNLDRCARGSRSGSGSGSGSDAYLDQCSIYPQILSQKGSVPFL